MTRRDEAVMKALRENGPMTSREISDRTGIETNRVSKSISNLRKYGMVELVWGEGKPNVANVWGACGVES